MVSFAVSGHGSAYLESGFSFPEPFGTWTTAETATLRLPLAAAPLNKLRLALDFYPSGFLRFGPTGGGMSISVNGCVALEMGCDRALPDESALSWEVGGAVVAGRNEMVIEFSFKGLDADERFSGSPDPRWLGIGLRQLTIEYC